jgi:hypothetical protein
MNAPGADYSAAGLEDIADQLVAQLDTAGADGVEALERTPTTVAGHPALDFRLSFTATDGKRSIWKHGVMGRAAGSRDRG